jgi:hypothetical protein
MRMLQGTVELDRTLSFANGRYLLNRKQRLKKGETLKVQ